MKLTTIPTFQEVEKVHKRIKQYINQTPVLSSTAINEMSGAEIYFKCENFQKVGAFKMRGAANAILALTDEERARGVATHSSGNHAQAVALSAKNHGVPAYIVMPENAPSIKRAATAGYGAEIITCAPTLAARESTLEKVVEACGRWRINEWYCN